MKKIFLIGSLFLSLCGYSQKKVFINDFYGVGIPLGDYQTLGYSKIGFNYGIEGGYYFTKNIGAGARFSVLTNSADPNLLLDDAEYSFSSIGYNSMDATVGKWTLINICGGVYSKINLAKSVLFEVKGLAGIVIAKSPNIELNVYTEYGNFKTKQSSSSATAFQYTGELGFKFLLSESFSLNIHGGISGANPFFMDRYSIQVDNEAPEYDNASYFQKVLTINTGIGFSFYF